MWAINMEDILNTESSNKDRRKAECPYCLTVLKKVPGAKTKCSFCGKYIYVRTRPDDNWRVVVTEQEAQRIDKQWLKEPSHSRWKRELEDLGMGSDDFERTRLMLAKKFGQEPRFGDIIWSLFNQVIIKDKGLNPPYYSMALFLDEEGKNPAKMLFEHSLFTLKSWFKTGVKTVKIYTAGDEACDNCRKLEGLVIPIVQALKEPVIPCENCIYHMSQNSRFGFCRCYEVPEDVGDAGLG